MNFNSANPKTILLVFFTILVLSLIFILYLNNTVQKDNFENLNKRVLLINLKSEPVNKRMNNLTIVKFSSAKNTSQSIINDWNNIANIISNNYDKQEAFIIYTEIETMTYLASALSFILENINKPIIITNDNLNQSITLASKIDIPEVMISSNNKLIRACCSAQIDKKEIVSPNYNNLTKDNCLKLPTEKFNTKFLNPALNIIIIKFFPGIDVKNIINLLENKEKVNGIVLELYCDNKILISKDFFELFKDIIKKGIIIVAVSQCNYYDSLDLNLLKSGVIPGFDMTISAAFTKLLLVLSHVKDKDIIPQLFERSLRGEISEKYSVM